MLTSVMNEGFAGMQQSQKRMQQAALDIVRAGVPRERGELNPTSTNAAPVTDAGAAVTDLPGSQAVGAPDLGESPAGTYASQQGDLVEPLIEQRRQQLLFDASARVVGTVSETLGSLIDDLS